MNVLYYYKAQDISGQLVKGQAYATSETVLGRILKQQGLYLLRAKAQGNRRNPFLTLFLRRRYLQEICFHLYLLLSGGIPLVPALEMVREQLPSSPSRYFLSRILISCHQGFQLSQVLQHYPGIFDPVLRSILKIGEATGKLDKSFERINSYLEWQQKTAQQLRRAWIYPLLVGGVLTALICVLMLNVIPQLHAFLDTNLQTLPFSTKLLLGISAFLVENFLILGISCFSVIAVFIILQMLFPLLKIHLDRCKLLMPLAGKLLVYSDTERFVYTLQNLYESEIPVLECLQHARQNVKNRWLQKRLENVHLRIQHGEMLSSALQQEKVFSGVLPRLIAAGEQAGNLTHALKHAQRYYHETLQAQLDTFLSLLEPVLLILLGTILMWVAVAVFMPLYDNIGYIL